MWFDIILAVLIFVALFIGYLAGQEKANKQWAQNSFAGMRILHRNQYYKVLLLNSPQSWGYIDNYRQRMEEQLGLPRRKKKK